MAKGGAAASRNLVAARVVYGAAWLACLALYWGGLATGALGGGGIMGYTLLALYVVLPAAGFVSSLLIGRTAYLGRWRVVAAPAIAIFFGLFIKATFGLSNMLGLTNIADDGLFALVLGLVPAAIGLAIGWATARRSVVGSQ